MFGTRSIVHRFIVLVWAAAVVLVFTGTARAGGYTLVDLGTLGGLRSEAMGINNSGQVTGWAELSGGSQRAFLWDSTNGMRSIGTLGGPHSIGEDINELGQITGQTGRAGSLGANEPFFWNGVTMLGLGFLDPSLPQGAANGVNDVGQVVGSSRVAAVGTPHAFIWDAGTGMRDLGVSEAGRPSEAHQINRFGVVVGVRRTSSGDFAFRWTSAGLTDLTAGTAYAVNELGWVTGAGFVNGPAGTQALPLLPGTTISIGHGINKDGVVTGWSSKPGDPLPFVYRDGTILDLNQQLRGVTGWTLVRAQDINDHGEIVGTGISPTGWIHAFVLSPLPESSQEQTFGPGTGIHGRKATNWWGDPVNSATGAYTTSAVDLSLGGVGVPFVFTRSYTSADPTTGRLGRGWRDSLSASLVVLANGDVRLHGEDGQQVLFAKQADSSFEGAPGATSTLAATAGGYELRTHEQRVYSFDTAGSLGSLVDRNGQGLALSYDPGGNLVAVTDSAARQISLAYSGALLQSVELPDGRIVRFTHTDGLLTSVLHPGGGMTQYGYDGAGRLQSVTNQKGVRLVQNTYDSDGRVVEQLDAQGARSLFSWDPATETAIFTNARGNSWKDTYSDNVRVAWTDPLGHTTSFTYDQVLNLLSRRDPRGAVTRMTYDDRGNLLTRVAPAPFSYSESWSYDARNNVVRHVDGRGNTTSFEYDPAGNMTKVTQANGSFVSYERDPGGRGLLAAVTDPAGATTRFSHDAAGNLIRIVSPRGSVTSLAYDGSGRLTRAVEPRGNIAGVDPSDFAWTFEHDAENRVVSQRDPLGAVTTFSFDSEGAITGITDALDRTTSYGYDPSGRITSVTPPGGDVGTSHTYDVVGNLTSRRDGNGRVTGYVFDEVNRVVRAEAPGGRIWSFGYDANGNRTSIIDANGNGTATVGDGTTSLEYDALDRLSRIVYSDTTPAVQFAYDGNGNRTTMIDGAGTETYALDALNRLVSVTRAGTGFSYAYDPSGNLARTTYPDGTAVDYAYDSDGNVTSAASGGTATTFAYDVAGNLVTTTLPAANGYIETRSYDRRGSVVSVESARGTTTLSSFAYTFDQVGRPSAVSGTDGTTTYGYDARDRLTEVCFTAACATPAIQYEYDAVGNRLSETRSDGAVAYQYDEADRLLSRAGPAGSMAYTYDLNGNQTSAGPLRFGYDLADRLASAVNGRTATTYTYDGDGKRISSATGSRASLTTRYLWDVSGPMPQLALERDGRDRLLRRYLYGAGRYAFANSAGTFYYHRDRLESVVNVTSQSGATQWSYSYEPFGSARSATRASNKAPVNPMRFTGELLDPAASLYHLRAREYDSQTGRFLQIDPVAREAMAGSASPYAYVDNQPTTMLDPTGRCLLCITAAVGGVGNGLIYLGGSALGLHDTTWRGFGGAVASGAVAGAAAGPLGALAKSGLAFIPIASRPVASKTIGVLGGALAGSLTGAAICGSPPTARDLGTSGAAAGAGLAVSENLFAQRGFPIRTVRGLLRGSPNSRALLGSALFGGIAETGTAHALGTGASCK